MRHRYYTVFRTLHDVFARCIWVLDGWTISCLLHRIQSRSIGVDMRHCVWIRVDGLGCQAFQYVRWVCFASTLHNEVWAQGWLICCSVEWLWSYCCYILSAAWHQWLNVALNITCTCWCGLHGSTDEPKSLVVYLIQCCKVCVCRCAKGSTAIFQGRSDVAHVQLP